MAILCKCTDEELILRMKSGEQTAFTEIYNRHWEKMASYAIRLTRSEDEAADIVQEIFVSLWNRSAELEIKGTLISYLIKATRNLSLRYIQKNIVKHDFLLRLSAHHKISITDIVEEIIVKELQLKVDDAVTRLPSKMQQIYLLSRNEQLSYREIAELLGIAEGTVKKQISNALKLISASISPGITYLIIMHLLHH